MPRIIVETRSDMRWPSGSVSVELNGHVLAKIALNARHDFMIEAGSHTLLLKHGNSSSSPVRFRAAEHESLAFRCTISGYLRSTVLLEALFRREATDRFTHRGSRVRDRRHDDAAPWHVVLNVSDKAQMNEIRDAYLRLIKIYHPDRVSGLREIDKRNAEEQARLLNLAYAEAKKRDTL